MNDTTLADYLRWGWWLLAAGVLTAFVLRWCSATTRDLPEKDSPRAQPPPGSIDAAILAAGRFARTFRLEHLQAPPRRRLAVVACMDCRLPVEELFGLKPGEAHILRNAGAIVTEDVVRSLLLSHHLMGVREVLILQHTECGLTQCREEELVQHLERTTGQPAPLPVHFHTFRDLEANVRTQVRRLRAHPWLARGVFVRGFVYDVRTGGVTEVTA